MKPRPAAAADLICLSHLRWNFVYQRPQHLMTRCARERRVFFVEEPLYEAGISAHLRITNSDAVVLVVPCLPAWLSRTDAVRQQRALLNEFRQQRAIGDFVLWYYTPMALDFTHDWSPRAIVYDCMDELAAFKGAPASLKQREAELMRRASLVFTGGHSLYEAKRNAHANIHPFPSSVDIEHFGQARRKLAEPDDQAAISRPRLGFFGVVDERMNLDLIEGVARARPDWQLVMVGPVVKIDPSALPRRPNIHYLGPKAYQDLPRYISGWDVALMPFARNDATRYISPTKTLEYMAAGKPVVSTSIRDVVRPYGREGLVRIADDVAGFVRACSAAMVEDAAQRNRRADVFLRQTSWDGTWNQMRLLVERAIHNDAGPEGRGAADDAAAV